MHAMINPSGFSSGLGLGKFAEDQDALDYYKARAQVAKPLAKTKAKDKTPGRGPPPAFFVAWMEQWPSVKGQAFVEFARADAFFERKTSGNFAVMLMSVDFQQRRYSGNGETKVINEFRTWWEKQTRVLNSKKTGVVAPRDQGPDKLQQSSAKKEEPAVQKEHGEEQSYAEPSAPMRQPDNSPKDTRKAPSDAGHRNQVPPCSEEHLPSSKLYASENASPVCAFINIRTSIKSEMSLVEPQDVVVGCPQPTGCALARVPLEGTLPLDSSQPQDETETNERIREGCATRAVNEARCPACGHHMIWTRNARYNEYLCSGCSCKLRGARWHCAAHKEDFCSTCRPAPKQAACAGGGGDIVDSSWREPLQKSRKRDPLLEMLDAQERVILGRRLDTKEAKEMKETMRSMGSKGVPRQDRGSQQASTWTTQCSAIDQNLMDEDAARQRPSWAENGESTAFLQECAPMHRTCDLTMVLTGDLIDELARGYAQPWFQTLVHQCACDCYFDRAKFLTKLQDIAFEVQKPILENWGFEGNLQGVFDMTSIIREHSYNGGEGMPMWLKQKRDVCLTLLYGGEKGGMLDPSKL